MENGTSPGVASKKKKERCIKHMEIFDGVSGQLKAQALFINIFLKPTGGLFTMWRAGGSQPCNNSKTACGDTNAETSQSLEPHWADLSDLVQRSPQLAQQAQDRHHPSYSPCTVSFNSIVGWEVQVNEARYKCRERGGVTSMPTPVSKGCLEARQILISCCPMRKVPVCSWISSAPTTVL